jgi:hypothetical protein
MQFSMARKFKLRQLRRYSVKPSKMSKYSPPPPTLLKFTLPPHVNLRIYYVSGASSVENGKNTGEA